MKQKNNLPKYWVVKNDGSQLFKDTVIEYLNSIRQNFSPLYGTGVDSWYGINSKGRVCYGESFLDAEILSIEEFIKLSNQEPEFKMFDQVLVLTDTGHWGETFRIFITDLGPDYEKRYITFLDGPRTLYSWKNIKHIPKDSPIIIDDKEVIFEEDGIKVGCTKVSSETIEKIYKKIHKES